MGLPFLQTADAITAVSFTATTGGLTLPASAGIVIPAGVPSPTTDKLYNNGGTIYFNGAALGSAAGTVTSVTAGNGMTQSGTSTVNPTLDIVSHAGTANTIGTINIGADAIGVNLGTTNITACSGADGRLSDSRTPTGSGAAISSNTIPKASLINMTAAGLLGNSAAGAVGEITLGTSLSFSGSVLNGVAVNAGTLGAAAVTAGATNTTVALNFSAAWNANSASNVTINPVVGPAITALTTAMTGAGSGVLKKTGADTYSVTSSTTVGENFLTLSNPGAITFPRIDAANTVTALAAAAFVTAIGAEPALGNPGTTGWVLSSTTAGVRSWVANGSGGLTLSSALTGFTLGTDGTALAATDTILQGYQKLQVQANSKVPISGVTTVTYAATVNINLTTITTSVARITLTGPCTINFTGGNDGQKVTLELLQDGTGGRVVTLGTGVGYGTDITSYTGTTTLNKRDILGFQYNSSLSKALLIGVAKGY